MISIPTYYIPMEGVCGAYVSVYESWDGSLYAETNIKDAQGPSVMISTRHGLGVVGGFMTNSPLGDIIKT